VFYGAPYESFGTTANLCRTSCAKGGVCTNVHKSLKFVSIDEKHCKEKDFEACALELYLNFKSVCIVTIYRAPSGNFNSFITKLDTILRKLYISTLESIIYSDININYFTDSEKNSQLEPLLQTYNLKSTVDFPTRIQKNSITTIDDNFIDIARRDSYSVCPIINGLSDRDAKSITFNTITWKPPTKQIMETRKINKYTINDFLTKLAYETWDITFSSGDVNIMFNDKINYICTHSDTTIYLLH